MKTTQDAIKLLYGKEIRLRGYIKEGRQEIRDVVRKISQCAFNDDDDVSLEDAESLVELVERIKSCWLDMLTIVEVRKMLETPTDDVVKGGAK